MRTIMQRFKLSSIVVLLAMMPAAAPIFAQTEPTRVGARHFGFTLPAIDDGRPVSLEQFRGKKVLLIQFASW
jgi:hypothetical protein